ncbi:hypothetical protein OS121_02350 [Mycolicibacterium mucogenicum]|uniref:hypothetical protein n=1 Tax=Mycolicibacterium mucogenicum TaxID=56689 RepID=UPI00226AF34A|nr:hypothetical protein [Mycolicibacterium mucogenicum]MCX8553941.1 hypothetical protein [Mycolicibacterium mucogenicum]
MTELSRNRPVGPDTHHDWAPYSDLAQAAEAYLRDPAIALESLYRVMDPSAIKAFVMERTLEEKDSRESLYQEVAVTDGRTLLLWMGDDELTDDDDPEPGEPLLTSTLRSIPLSALTDRNLKVGYRIDHRGGRSLHSVELRLVTTTADYTLAKTPSRTESFSEELLFTKSVTDGGRAQMERLIQFGRVLAAHG